MESNKIDNLPEPKAEIPNKNNIFHKKRLWLKMIWSKFTKLNIIIKDKEFQVINVALNSH